MCLAIPGRIVECFQKQELRMARVQFGGIIREACLEYVPDAQVGDYVLVHVGFALSRIDEEEALRTYALLEELDQLTDLQAGLDQEEPEEAAS
jgi:hydrogenase expression/formation protein HypC